LVANEGLAKARAVRGTSYGAEQLVVFLGTVVQAVTDVAGVDTSRNSTTAVESWTRESLTPRLVLFVRTVAEAVASHEDRQTVAVVGALEVALRTPGAGF
jgi:hypothetical protein